MMQKNYDDLLREYVSAARTINKVHESRGKRETGTHALEDLRQAKYDFIMSFKSLAQDEIGRLGQLDKLVHDLYHSCMEIGWSYDFRNGAGRD